ncbi:hypothetical protein [Neolewinella sp.]|uniref:hypothetical protein n=1 Tax=Neolewinella sp. TaxID=2993543 RepID=UPI003B51A194
MSINELQAVSGGQAYAPGRLITCGFPIWDVPGGQRPTLDQSLTGTFSLADF